MKFMFTYDEALTSIDLSSFDTSMVSNYMAMFQGCTGLNELDITSFNLSNGENFNQIFNYNNNLTVYVKEEAKNIEKFVNAIPEDVNIKYIPSLF